MTKSIGQKTFSYRIHVPYAHVDQMSIVYYANYLVYFEMARSAFLREVGLPYADMEARGILLPVVESHVEYKKPARFDDLLEMRSRVTLQRLRLHVDCEVWRGEELLVKGYTEHVCMNREGKVTRLAPELKRLTGEDGEGKHKGHKEHQG